MERIEIGLSRPRLILLLAAGLAFVAIGLAFVSSGSPLHMAVGMVGVLLGGFGVFGVARKFLDPSPGFVITREGFTDNSSFFGSGFVSWSDVDEIEEVIYFGQRLLVIYLKNPGSHLQRQTNPLMRRMLEWSYQRWGWHIVITAVGLRYRLSQLRELLQDRFENSKR